MIIKIGNIQNDQLHELALNLKVETIELLRSAQCGNEEYRLYRVSHILAIEFKYDVIPDWDDRFEKLYARLFDFQTNEK